VEIAGMRESDFKLSLQERLLLIRGVRPDVLERRAYHQLEIPFGEFASEVELSVPVVAEQVTAEYKEGFLKIILPKARPQQIHVGE
jgi:HSP20 family protein